jgi:hypothetical protein
MISLIEGCCLKRSHWPKSSWWLSWSHNLESLTVAIMTWLTVTEYLCNKWARISSACCSHNPILLLSRLIVRCLWVMSATSEARTVNPSVAAEFSERKGQTIQCPKEKDKQYNVRKKRTRRQTMVDKTLLRKLKIGNTNLTKNRDEFSCYGRVDSSCFTSGTHHS